MPAEYKQPLFSPEELAENQRRKAYLIEACASQESVLVAGAGISKRLGYPVWNELLDRLRGLVEILAEQYERPFAISQAMVNDELLYADCLRGHIEACTNNLDRYYSFLCQTFNWKVLESHGQDMSLHRQLVALPFCGIITTNYDPGLDHALSINEPIRPGDRHFIVNHEHATNVSEFVASLRQRASRKRQIAHLHGRFDSPHSIVLTGSDYRKQYDSSFGPSQRTKVLDLFQRQGVDATLGYIEENTPEWTLHRKFLWALLATRSAVFVGFSMEDPYFTKMLKTVVEDLWRWDQPSHFAVMPISETDAFAKEKARRLLSEYGVAVVFYENPDGRHEGLDSLVQEICSACDVGGPPKSVEVVEVQSPIKTTGMSKWMATINDRTRRRAGSQ